MDANPLLDALLHESGMSRAGLASRVNRHTAGTRRASRYDHASVLRWLQGQRPREPVPSLIAAIFSDHLGRPVTLEETGMSTDAANVSPEVPIDGFIGRATALWRRDHSHPDPPQQLPTLGGLDAVAPVWEWETPPHDTDVSRAGTHRVQADDLATLRAARTHFEHMYRKAGGVATRGRILRYLAHDVAPLLRGSYSDPVGRELHRAAGGIVAIAGICSYDSDAQGLAQRYLHHALRHAKACGDRAFGGYVIALLTNQSIYLGEYRRAVGLAEAGLRSAGHAISPALACDLHAMQAKAYARLGDHGEARRCMTAAETAAGTIRPDAEPAETSYVQPGLLETQLADTLRRMGDAAPAQVYAAEAVAVQAHARGRVHRLATLTDCHLAGGDIDQAASTAELMLATMQGMESRRLADRLTRVRAALTATSTPSVRDVAERIDSTLRIPL